MLAAIDVGSSEVSMKIYQFSKRTGIQELGIYPFHGRDGGGYL